MLSSYSTSIFSQIIKWGVDGGGFHVTGKNIVFHNIPKLSHRSNMINENIRYLHKGDNKKAHEGNQNNQKMTYCMIHQSGEV